MAITLPKKIIRSQTGIFIQAVIILFGLIGGYLYYSQLIRPNKQAITVTEVPRQDVLSKFKDIRSFNFEIFNRDYFKALKILGEAPVLPGATGRSDIFAP